MCLPTELQRLSVFASPFGHPQWESQSFQQHVAELFQEAFELQPSWSNHEDSGCTWPSVGPQVSGRRFLVLLTRLSMQHCWCSCSVPKVLPVWPSHKPFAVQPQSSLLKLRQTTTDFLTLDQHIRHSVCRLRQSSGNHGHGVTRGPKCSVCQPPGWKEAQPRPHRQRHQCCLLLAFVAC